MISCDVHVHVGIGCNGGMLSIQDSPGSPGSKTELWHAVADFCIKIAELDEHWDHSRC